MIGIVTIRERRRMKTLTKYLLSTFLITWTLWWGDAVLVSSTGMKESDLLPMILFTAGGFGPAAAALICFDKKRNAKNLCGFVFGCNKKSVWALLLFLFLEAAVFGLSSMERNPAIALPSVPMILLQAAILYGGNEEPGWRGIMQPILQSRMPYPAATFIVGITWALWHIPLWFIKGNSPQGTSFFLFAVLAILLSFWLSAVTNSKGSVFWCMIMHGAVNTLLSVFVIKVNGILLAGLSVLTVLAAIIGMRSAKRTAWEPV